MVPDHTLMSYAADPTSLLLAMSLVPTWLAGLCAITGYLAVGLYWLRLRKRGVPRSRRRLRLANSVVHVVLIFALFYGLGVVDPDANSRRFVVTWIGVMLLTIISVLFAAADMLNNLRLYRRDRLRAQLDAHGELHSLLRREPAGPEHADEGA